MLRGCSATWEGHAHAPPPPPPAPIPLNGGRRGGAYENPQDLRPIRWLVIGGLAQEPRAAAQQHPRIPDVPDVQFELLDTAEARRHSHETHFRTPPSGGGASGVAPFSRKCVASARSAPSPGDAEEGKGPQKRVDRRLEEVAQAIGGGYCRLQMPLILALAVALAVRETASGHRLGALEGGGQGTSHPSNASLPPPPPPEGDVLVPYTRPPRRRCACAINPPPPEGDALVPYTRPPKAMCLCHIPAPRRRCACAPGQRPPRRPGHDSPHRYSRWGRHGCSTAHCSRHRVRRGWPTCTPHHRHPH